MKLFLRVMWKMFPAAIIAMVICMILWLLATNPEWLRFLLVVVGLTAIGLMSRGQHG